MAEELVSGWGSLPAICLRHVFSFLADSDRTSADVVCHHWHSVMRSPSLWRSHFFHFNGRLSRHRQSEYCSAVTYARYLGVYLEKLEVCVCPPRRTFVAQRLQQIITGLLSELIRVRAPLRSLSIVRLELDRPTWSTRCRRSLINSLIHFLRSGASKLSSLCLNRMQNRMHQGLELLSVISDSQQYLLSQRCISFLCLDRFFSGTLHLYRDATVPRLLMHLHGLNGLCLSYSCVSDMVLMALQQRYRGVRGISSGDATPLQTLSLYCTSDEPHRHVVQGESWAALVSSFPDLKVKITVDQIVNTDRLARILLQEVPLAEFSMTAYYSSREGWRARPLLHTILPQYSHSLQCLYLDLISDNESLDEELLRLVKVCKCLEKLVVWAFLEIRTVRKLLEIRLKRRHLLNKIRVSIYAENDIAEELEDQLEEELSSYGHLPPELEFNATIYLFE